VGRVKTFGLVGTAAFACLLTAASLAAAGTPGTTASLGTSKGLEYMKASYTAVVSQTSQPVSCDGDAEATGGGGSITGAPGESVLNESYPTLPGPTGWTVEGSNPGTAQDLKGYAICAGVDTNVATSDEDIGAGSSVTQNTFCPSSEEFATGGGIEAASSGVEIGATYPPELITDRWFGLATNTTGGTIDVDYHAVCTDAYSVRYRNSDVVRVKPGETGKAAATCGREHAVLGGGFVGYYEGLPASGGSVSASRPFDSKKDRKSVPDDGWLAKYHNDSVSAHRLLVVAVCKAGNAPG
jgi:hypothetical protein